MGDIGPPPIAAAAAAMEVNLWNDKREREMLDSFADIYAIIKTTEKLECLQLISQLKTLSFSLRDVVPSIDRFADAYKMDHHAALNRLLISGVPATVEHRAPSAAECVQHFITAMDSLKHNMILPLDFEGRVKVRERQLHFDLESSYNAFMPALPNV